MREEEEEGHVRACDLMMISCVGEGQLPSGFSCSCMLSLSPKEAGRWGRLAGSGLLAVCLWQPSLEAAGLHPKDEDWGQGAVVEAGGGALSLPVGPVVSAAQGAACCWHLEGGTGLFGGLWALQKSGAGCVTLARARRPSRCLGSGCLLTSRPSARCVLREVSALLWLGSLLWKGTLQA